MPYVFKQSQPPEPWHEARRKALHRYLVPLYYANWLGEWAAYILGKWSLFEVLEYAGSFSILIAVIFYFAGSGDRMKQKHYQAWQVINTAQGKGGSGGRGDAMQELNEDHVPLVGVDVSDAFLQDINLPAAELRRGSFASADMRRAILRKSDLEEANFRLTNLRGADIRSADLTDASFRDADLNGARLGGAKLSGVDFKRADLRETDLLFVSDWKAIKSLRLANLHGIHNVPDGFIDWAKHQGAVDIADDTAWNRLLDADPSQPPH
jgi:hypothetical protein